MEVKPHEARSCRRRPVRPNGAKRTTDRRRKPESPVQLRAMNEFGFCRQGLGREFFGEGAYFTPCVACNDERMRRDCAHVTNLRIPLVTIEDCSRPHRRKG